MSRNQFSDTDAAPAPDLLTLAMIVRDGAQFLAPLLAAAAPWVDEIVIGDTGSTDHSVAIGRQYGAQVHHLQWRDDFAWARNQVLEQCHGAWVLVLDADEQLAEPDWCAIRQWVQQHHRDDRLLAASLGTRNYLPDRYSRRGWQPIPNPDPHTLTAGAPTDGFVVTSKVRLFPNQPEVQFRGPIHETVEASLWDAGILIEDLSLPVHHFGYLQPRPDKDEFYLHLAHRKTTEQPHDPQAWAELADSAIAVKDYRQALVAIERSLRLEPTNLDRRLTAGWLLKETNDFAAAEQQLGTLTSADASDDLIVAEAAHLRALMAIQNNEFRQAAVLLAEALRRFPDNGHYQNTLGALNLALGRGEAAQRALQRSCEILPHQAEPCLNLALLYQNANEPELSRKYYAEALLRDPGNEQAAEALGKTALAPVAG